MTVNPVDRDADKAENAAEKNRKNGWKRGERSFARHLPFENHDGDGEDLIAECFETMFAYPRSPAWPFLDNPSLLPHLRCERSIANDQCSFDSESAGTLPAGAGTGWPSGCRRREASFWPRILSPV